MNFSPETLPVSRDKCGDGLSSGINFELLATSRLRCDPFSAGRGALGISIPQLGA
jgi:hypothetical protein